MTLPPPEPVLLDGPRGRLFALLQRPAGEARRMALCVPPFAEEMNKSRRALAETLRALARGGTAALLIDLYGTGDSEGEFAEASWAGWLDDLSCARAFLVVTLGALPLDVLAVRAGALLAAEWLARDEGCDRLVLWQPVADGRTPWMQFLRLRVMASRFAGREESVAGLEETMHRNGVVEVAGYKVPRPVAEGLAASRLEACAPRVRSGVTLIEAAMPGPARPTVPVGKVIARWRGCGLAVEWRGVATEPCWATQEIACPQALIDVTVDALHKARRQRAPSPEAA